MGEFGAAVSKAVRASVLPKFRGLLEVDGRKYEADATFVSAVGMMMDVQQQLYTSAPKILSVTVILMFISIAYMFGAALMPFKLILTVIIPLTFVYGAAV